MGSPSTFSLWAALLSDAAAIHFPLVGMFNPLWSGPPCNLRPWVQMGPFDPRLIFHDMHSCRLHLRGEAGLLAERARLASSLNSTHQSYCSAVRDC